MPPLILVTNDDGVYSPGLRALAEVALTFGEVLISAPALQQTSMSRATGSGSGQIERIDLRLNGALHPAYAVHGTPARAAQHGIVEIAARKPDLVLSGINYGENLGYTITRSGTIGAAIEAAGLGVPGIALSLESHPDAHYATDYPPMNWDAAAWAAAQVAARVLEHGLPAGTDLLNVNVPDGATRGTPMRWTRVSRHNYYEVIEQEQRSWDQPYRLRERRIARPDVERDSDIYSFAVERAITITPLCADLTARGFEHGWVGLG
jgi:5'-nucleotidase